MQKKLNTKYQHIVSLDGDKYIIYYNDNTIKEIDITEGEVEESLRQELITLLAEAYDDTDPSINHSKTIDYVKQEYISKLNKLYFSFFQHHIKYIDNIPFYINSQYLHYYNEFVQCIAKQNTTIPFYFDFDKKEIHWNTHIIAFDKFLEYIDTIKIYIATLNQEFQQDKKWIESLDANIDFSGTKDISQELAMMTNAQAEFEPITTNLQNELKLLFTNIDQHTLDNAWNFLYNLIYNDENVNIYKSFTQEKQQTLQNYIELFKKHNQELDNIHQLIINEKSNVDKTYIQLNNIIAKWSI